MGTVSYSLTDASGTLVTSATPTFTKYLRADGASASAPSITHAGGGLYYFTAADPASVAASQCFLIDNGSANLPRYLAGSLGEAVAFVLTNASGTPTAGLSPTFSTFVNLTGTNKSAPTISDLGSGLYAFQPSSTDLEEGRQFLIAAPSTYLPAYIAGTLLRDLTAPVLSSLSPSDGTELAVDDTIAFHITDNSGSFRRVLLVAHYQGTGVMEVIHTGDAFGPQYTGSRASITNGYSYTGVIRRGGWPSAPTLVPYALDSSGNEIA